MHKWTKGRFWKNLIFLIRQSFSVQQLHNRARQDKGTWWLYQDPYEIIEIILIAAEQNEWMIEKNGYSRRLRMVCIIPYRF